MELAAEVDLSPMSSWSHKGALPARFLGEGQPPHTLGPTGPLGASSTHRSHSLATTLYV
jgi:hypothetical protein